MIGYLIRSFTGRTALHKTLAQHFKGVSLTEIVTAAREFPITSRVDLQKALEQSLGAVADARLLGVHFQMNHETATLAQLFTPGPFQVDLGPLQQEEVDIGDPTPVRCLKNGLWLLHANGLAAAILLSPSMQYGMTAGVHVEVGVPAGEAGAEFSAKLFRDLELGVAAGKTYRGRVISLECHESYSGRGGAVKVHRLHKVAREEVILPQKTIALLDRNIGRFVATRHQIKALRFSGKKGLLFYGPPGTGKTHTIHYLASQLPEHTTLIITAEQVGILGQYFRLARFMQPALMIVEDVDLIAREREEMHNPMQEVMLNRLLNEMDGLTEDADVLFILTTNRPDQLEPALAARPGRIDQAIEFPLPDEESRAKLVELYSRGVEVPPPLMDSIVRRTKGASPAFIKELLRRSAQFQIEFQGKADVLEQAAVDAAIEEMVFAGGSLNLKLLGGSSELADS